MKFNRLLFVLLASVTLLSACKKDHYDVGNVHGVNADGEVLAPVASASISVRDLMERFELMDMVYWDDQGDLALHFSVDLDSVLIGSELLKFKDLDYSEHFEYDNPYPTTPPPYIDTILHFERTITFDSEHILVMEGLVKSGRFDFEMSSNAGQVRHVVLRSPNIKDAEGHDFELDLAVHDNAFGFNMEGLRYVATEPNTLMFSYEVEVRSQTTHDPNLYFDVNIKGRGLAFSEMGGFVEKYSERSHDDTLLTLFPAEMDGMLEMEGLRVVKVLVTPEKKEEEES